MVELCCAVRTTEEPILIYADFMKMDHQGRLLLVCRGTLNDLEKNNLELKKGMKLTFYNEDEDIDGNRDDLVVEGVVERDNENQNWRARIIWNEIKNISQLSLDEGKKIGFQ